MKPLSLFSLIIIFNSFLSCQTNQPPTFTENREVDALFKEWNFEQSPGCALAVIKDGEIIYKKGYGTADLEHDVPITPATVFYIGSVSKQFVTMSILLLVEEGKINLDDAVQTYLPDFPTYEKEVTIRNLIHHTSGIRDYLTLWSLAGNNYLDHIDETAVYRMITRQKELNFLPGEQYLYSNSCYFMLSMIIEKASGKSLKEYAQNNIFKPLGMQNSHFHDDYFHIIRDRAFSYFYDENRFNNLIMRFDLVGSGGLYTSVEDLYLWDQNFYQNELGNSTQKLIENMHQEGILNNGESAGYAFALVNGEYRGLKTVSHGGALAGYRAQLMRFPDQNFSVVILSNLASFRPTYMAQNVAEVFLEDDMEPKEEDSSSENQDDEEAESYHPGSLEEYQGKFYSDELDVNYLLSIIDGKLSASAGNNNTWALEPRENDKFSAWFTLNFERDASGSISGFSVDAGRVQNLKFVKLKE
ncbi:MAG: class A beta-lactamase-related serine hydrolase [Bacteroidetes bacterium]|nr:MAG: class A beta-lactamase-related serine hydrolase [Bacteroidota bacterium]